MPLMQTRSGDADFEAAASHYVRVTSQSQPRLSLEEAEVSLRERRRQQRRARRLGGGKPRFLSTEPDAIDQSSRVLFPLLFTIFNILYWIIYQSVSSSTLEELYAEKLKRLEDAE